MEAKDENVDEIAGDDDALADELINEVSEDEGAQEEDKSDFAEGQDDDFEVKTSSSKMNSSDVTKLIAVH